MRKLMFVLMLVSSFPSAMANMTQSKPAAVDALSRALTRMPESADIHNYLCYAYRHLDDLNLSFTHYKEALRIDPKHRGAHEYIGEAYLKAGQPDKAAEHLVRLEQICGKRCEEYQDLAKSIGAYQKGK